MKILSLFLSLCLLTPAGNSPAQHASPPVSAAAGRPLTYALLLSESVLYSDTRLTLPVTTLPKTYFVIVMDSTEGSYYRVSYLDLTGYMNPLSLQIVDYEPVTKYASAFRFTVVNDGYPATLRSAPDHLASNKLTEIAGGYKGMYYGSVMGTSIIPELGNLWYYVRYDGPAGPQYGYIYKSQVIVDKIEDNDIQKVVKPPDDKSPPSPFEFTDTLTILLILSLTIPAVAVMLLIFRKKAPARIPRHRNDKES